jgi:hypothetical protein
MSSGRLSGADCRGGDEGIINWYSSLSRMQNKQGIQRCQTCKNAISLLYIVASCSKDSTAIGKMYIYNYVVG